MFGAIRYQTLYQLLRSIPRWGWLLFGGLTLLLILLHSARLMYHLSQHHQELMHRVEQQYLHGAEAQHNIADKLFTRYSNDPALQGLIKEYKDADPLAQQRIRGEILSVLRPHQLELAELGIRQFQLIDDQGHSLLRLSAPELHSDALMPVRALVTSMVLQQKAQHGFEQGRVKAGFSHIFPVVVDGEFLAGIEFMFSPRHISDQITGSVGDGLFYLLLESQQANGILLDSFFDRIQPVEGLAGWVLDLSNSSSQPAVLTRFLNDLPLAVKSRLQREAGIYHHPETEELLISLPIATGQRQPSALGILVMRESLHHPVMIGFVMDLAISILLLLIFTSLAGWLQLKRQQHQGKTDELALALRCGALGAFEYYPQRRLLKIAREGLELLQLDAVMSEQMSLGEVQQLIHPEDRQRLTESVQEYLQHRADHHRVEFRIRNNHGEWRWLISTGQTVQWDSHNIPQRYAGVVRDITPQKEIRLQLARSEQKYRQLFNCNKAIELIIDPDSSSIVDANDAAVAFYGYDHYQLCKMSLSQLTVGDRQSLKDDFAQALANKSYHFTYTHRLNDGENRDVEVYIGPVELDGKFHLFAVIHDISDRVRAEQALKESELRFSALLGASLDGIVMMNDRGVVEYWNPAATEILGYSAAEVSGKSLPNHLFPQRLKRQYLRVMQRGLDASSLAEQILELQVLHKDGNALWLELAVSQFVLDGHVHIVGSFRDITRRRQEQQQLKLAHIAFENASEGIIITDTEQRIVDMNQAVERITGYSRDELLGQQPLMFRSNLYSQSHMSELMQRIDEEGHWQGEIENRHKSGQIYSEWLNVSRVADSRGQTRNYVAVFSDISELKASQQRLEHIAHHDTLTSLPNRRKFMRQLDEYAQKGDQALLFIDLDGFKAVNDNYGHGVGDELLVALAGRLRSMAGTGEMAFRLGGDEFAMILRRDLSQRYLSRKAEEIVTALGEPVKVPSGHLIQVGASVGISVSSGEHLDGAMLLKRADSAMYQAKQAGKGRYCFSLERVEEPA